MTKQEMRIAVALAIGWVRRLEMDYDEYVPYVGWRKREMWSVNDDGERFCGFDELPHYESDLNACAEFEEMLSDAEILEYVQWLDRGALTKAPGRCEAFLRVKGLWKD